MGSSEYESIRQGKVLTESRVLSLSEFVPQSSLSLWHRLSYGKDHAHAYADAGLTRSRLESIEAMGDLELRDRARALCQLNRAGTCGLLLLGSECKPIQRSSDTATEDRIELFSVVAVTQIEVVPALCGVQGRLVQVSGHSRSGPCAPMMQARRTFVCAWKNVATEEFSIGWPNPFLRRAFLHRSLASCIPGLELSLSPSLLSLLLPRSLSAA